VLCLPLSSCLLLEHSLHHRYAFPHVPAFHTMWSKKPSKLVTVTAAPVPTFNPTQSGVSTNTESHALSVNLSVPASTGHHHTRQVSVRQGATELRQYRASSFTPRAPATLLTAPVRS
jgi:hypothetical protein